MKTDTILKAIMIACIIVLPFAIYSSYKTEMEIIELNAKIKEMKKPVNYDSIRIRNWNMNK
jgi:cell division protein FtsL